MFKNPQNSGNNAKQRFLKLFQKLLATMQPGSHFKDAIKINVTNVEGSMHALLITINAFVSIDQNLLIKKTCWNEAPWEYPKNIAISN